MAVVGGVPVLSSLKNTVSTGGSCQGKREKCLCSVLSFSLSHTSTHTHGSTCAGRL